MLMSKVLVKPIYTYMQTCLTIICLLVTIHILTLVIVFGFSTRRGGARKARPTGLDSVADGPSRKYSIIAILLNVSIIKLTNQIN